jgi:hypothetical protein
MQRGVLHHTCAEGALAGRRRRLGCTAFLSWLRMLPQVGVTARGPAGGAFKWKRLMLGQNTQLAVGRRSVANRLGLLRRIQDARANVKAKRGKTPRS